MLQKEKFYNSFQGVLDHTPQWDIKIIKFDFNTKIGHDNTIKERVMWRMGWAAWMRLKWLTDFSTFSDLVIGVSIFPLGAIYKATWISRDGRNSKQWDQITNSKKWRTSLLEVRVKRGPDVNSDHHLSYNHRARLKKDVTRVMWRSLRHWPNYHSRRINDYSNEW